MPNWVSTRLRVRGEKAAIEAFLGRIGGEGDQLVDFERIVPIDRSKYLLKTWKRGDGDDMFSIYNDGHCSVDMVEKVESDEVNENGDRFVGWSYDWYSAHLKEWGTKWNAGHFSLEWHGDGEVEIGFDTAWSVPAPVLVALFGDEFSQGLEIDFYCTEESWSFFINGNREGVREDLDVGQVMTRERKAAELERYIAEEIGDDPGKYDLERLVDDTCFDIDYGDGCYESFADGVTIGVYDLPDGDELGNYLKQPGAK